jgi:hypothetical protein
MKHLVSRSILAGHVWLAAFSNSPTEAAGWTNAFTSVSAPSLTAAGSANSGIALADFDRDGDTDVFTTGFGGNTLFSRITSTSFVAFGGSPTESVGDSRAASWGDFDGDGDPDLAVLTPGAGLNSLTLYRNAGGLAFHPLPRSNYANLQPNGVALAWADLDRDGWLDLVISTTNPGDHTHVLRNRGNGQFTDESTKANVPGGQENNCVVADFNGDGWDDLVLSGSTGTRVYRNTGQLTFVLVPNPTLTGAQSALAGDFDNDGRLDLFLAGTNAPSFLYLGNGDGTFVRKVSPATDSLAAPCVSATAADFNKDGWLDVAISHESPDGLRVFQNRGDASFEALQILSAPTSRLGGCAVADMDQDGNPDLVLARADTAGAAFLRNEGSGAQGISVLLKGNTPNTMAIGAKVRVRALIEGTERWQTRVVSAGGSYASQDDGTQHFGLGSATHADVLQIQWPSGKRTERIQLAANQRVEILEETLSINPPRLALTPGSRAAFEVRNRAYCPKSPRAAGAFRQALRQALRSFQRSP